MMKKIILYIVAALVWFTFVGCQSDMEPMSADELTPQPYSREQILVKFSPQVADLIAQNNLTELGATRSGVVSLDQLVAIIGDCKLERVFPDDERYAERTRQSGLDRWYVVSFDGKTPVEEVASSFAALGEVQSVDLNRTIKRAYNGKATPLSRERMEAAKNSYTRSVMNDPLLAEQWNLINNGDMFLKDEVVKSVKDADVQCQKAWEKSTGREDVIVAVLDEGIFVEHPDLKANIWVNENETLRSDEDNDGNGYAGDVNGYNFVYDTGVITWNNVNDSGHGSHVAGVISAVNNNGEGISSIAGGDGINGGVKIMVCQIFSGNVATSILSTVRAIKYAADNGAVVLQCSWGYVSGAANVYDWGYDSFASLEAWMAGSPLEREALEYFTHNAGSPNGPIDGGIAVFASGNESAPMAGYPGAADEYVSVAATAADFTPAVYTNYGPGTTISAPGGDQDYYYEYVDSEHNYGEVGCILSTLPYHISPSGYGFMEGTSMACPHVSGVVALAISHAAEERRHLRADELRELLHSTATPFDQYLEGKKHYRRYVADIGPLQPMQINMNDYKGKMGSGQVNASALLDAIAQAGEPMQFPNLYISRGEECAVAPAIYFKGGENLSYEVKIEDGSIATCRKVESMLLFRAEKCGATKSTITASDGTVHKFNITVRDNAGDNGWL